MGKKTFLIIFLCLDFYLLSAQFTLPPTNDTLGDYPYFFYNYWPGRNDNSHDGISCGRRVDLFFGNPDVGQYWHSNLVCDEYAVEMYTDDTILVVGMAFSQLNSIWTRITIYDSNMSPIWDFLDTFIHDQSLFLIDTSVHYVYLPDDSWPPNWMKFHYWGKGEEPIALCGKYYIGFISDCGGGNYCESACPYQLFEDHAPPHLFPKIEYRKLIDGVWTSGDSTRGIPLVFPIIVPQCDDDLDSIVTTLVGDTLLTVTWDTTGLRGIPTGRVDPAVDLWLGSSGTLPDTADTAGFARTFLPSFTYSLSSLQPGSYDLYIRKVCNAQYGIATDWRLVDTFTLSVPADTAIVDPPTDTTDVDTTAAIPNSHLSTLNTHLTIRPNPASDEVTLLSSYGITAVEAYNAAGTLVFSSRDSGSFHRLSDHALSLDLSSWPRGSYLLRIHTPAGTTTNKLIVQ